MGKPSHFSHTLLASMALVCLGILLATSPLSAQGVTTSSLGGIVSSDKDVLVGATIMVVHEPSGTRYGASSRENGQYNILNMRVGGPYTISVTYVGHKKEIRSRVYLSLAQDARQDFTLVEEAVQGEEVLVTGRRDEVMNSGRTGAATYVMPQLVAELPSIKRSTRDLTRLDPRSDGNYSFGGKNWLFNNISLDGSYFNNPYGLDDPSPGGQSNAEPVSFDAIEQVQVSVAPFDVREGGFTGAGINTVTKSGTNQYRGSIYSYLRNESLLGNTVSGKDVIGRPELAFNQSGFSVSGPIIENTLFFFLNGEIDRREDPGSNFVASTGNSGLGISRVRASTMDSIRQRMIAVYGYDPGPYQDYIHRTESNKMLLKLDWNISEQHSATFRFNILDAFRDQGPHPFVLSPNGTGRGPNENTLPFYGNGYQINNKLSSFALEVNSRFEGYANRFFVSYNRFRDFREPFSKDFPTVQIAENGVTYTTMGSEPFSIHNILDQDVLQVTNNFSMFMGNHVVTVGGNFETFSFFNAFNIFRHGVFFLPYGWFPGTATFSSLAEFFTATHPDSVGRPGFADFNSFVTPSSQPFKGEDINVGQLAFYAQDEYLMSKDLSVTVGLRVDIPMYLNDMVANPFSTDSVSALDENGNAETVNQGKMPEASLLFSPRIGFNWDVLGDRSVQLRGGTGIFTGRLPFVWVGNVISNPGQNPNLPAHLRSFDLNAADPDFKWPQVWTTNLAADHQLPWGLLGTLEFIYSKDINAVYVRNADLRTPVRYLTDGRPYYGGGGNNELNPDGGAGIYVIDNTSDGYNYNLTAQLRKTFDFGLVAAVSYGFLEAKSNLKSTEIASVLWSENPVQGNPNKPELGYSEFGNRHRIAGNLLYRQDWSEMFSTSFGVFFEFAEGNKFAGAGGNRYSFTYSGDVNGDGMGGNDLIYIPRNQSEIIFDPYTVGATTVTAAEQWAAFDKFIAQDAYLSANRGKIAERFGAINPWFSNIDLKILQDIKLDLGSRPHTFQISLDILNVGNMLNSNWGVRQVASSAATSPLQLTTIDVNGAPHFTFKGNVTKTYVDDPGLNSRWQAQIGVRYIF